MKHMEYAVDNDIKRMRSIAVSRAAAMLCDALPALAALSVLSSLSVCVSLCQSLSVSVSLIISVSLCQSVSVRTKTEKLLIRN